MGICPTCWLEDLPPTEWAYVPFPAVWPLAGIYSGRPLSTELEIIVVAANVDIVLVVGLARVIDLVIVLVDRVRYFLRYCCWWWCC